MAYIIPTPEIEDKQKQVEPYLIGAGKFKKCTPDYIKKMHEEILDFYRKETDGIQ